MSPKMLNWVWSPLGNTTSISEVSIVIKIDQKNSKQPGSSLLLHGKDNNNSNIMHNIMPSHINIYSI